jgi:hypothetical protein
LICQRTSAQKNAKFSTTDYVRALKYSTDVMLDDVTSPVAAARYYAYICLTANETSFLFNPEQPHFGGSANGLKEISVDQSLVSRSDENFAVILALYKSGARFLPSGYILKGKLDSLFAVAKKKKISADKIKATSDLVDSVLARVAKYSAADGFSKLSGYKRFTPNPGDAYWQPTAPGFMAPVEPYWYTLRTFILDSSSQFNGGSLAAYDTAKGSVFYGLVKEVYDISKNLSKEQENIARFWDCNPFALQQVGHLEFGLKKISPGGHWMGITGIACKKRKLRLSQTAYVHSAVALGLCDAFVSCWYNKYQSNRVRPVTVVKRLFDPQWSPVLQTPPFPEYTSGHSVISTTAATILTSLFGDNFSYVDNTEVEFGLQSRKFTSFKQASAEAAVSRLYGGIHYRDAIDNGVKEGEQIGGYIVRKVNVRSLTAR